MTRRRWDIGGGFPAVEGAGVSGMVHPDAPANDRPAGEPTACGRGILHRAEGAVRVRTTMPSGRALTARMPIAWYAGVTADVEIGPDARLAKARVILSHRDPALEVVLFEAVDDTDLVAAWRGLSRDLGLPMLMRTEAGDVATAPHLGTLPIGSPAPRRAPRAFLKRRPKALRRRSVGVVAPRRAARG